MGLTTGNEICIVTEFMDGGSLFNYLRNCQVIEENDLISIVKGISAGMLHLVNKILWKKILIY